MSYSRVTPRARTGTTGISEETDLTAGAGVWISPPDRVAAVTVAVHISSGTATFTIEQAATVQKQSATAEQAVTGIMYTARASHYRKILP